MTGRLPCYLDTSALMRRAGAACAAPSLRDSQTGALVQALLDDDVRVAASPLTLIEFRQAIATCWIDSRPISAAFDHQWARDSVLKVMQLVADDRIEIVDYPRLYQDAATLCDVAARRGIKFRAWDAIHLMTASRWANESGSRVTLVTTDSDYGSFTAVFDFFNSVVSIRNLDDEVSPATP